MAGGLARRATYFTSLLERDPKRQKTLFLAGANEFFDMSDPSTLRQGFYAKPFAQAYDMLGYDRVYLKQDEAKWLTENQRDLPGSFRVLGAEPLAEILTVGEAAIGVVVLPELPAETAEAPSAMVKSVVEAAKALRPKVKLLIAVSPWGHRAEMRFLLKADPVFDLFLGGGRGPGQPGEWAADDKTFWTRSYNRGRMLNQVKLYEWPNPTGRKRWTKDAAVQGETPNMGEEIAHAPHVWNLFNSLRDQDKTRAN